MVEAYVRGGDRSEVDTEIFPLELTDNQVQSLVDFLLTLSSPWQKL